MKRAARTISSNKCYTIPNFMRTSIRAACLRAFACTVSSSCVYAEAHALLCCYIVYGGVHCRRVAFVM